LDCIARLATGKAVVGVGSGVDFAAWLVVLMEGAVYLVVLIGLYFVMSQYLKYWKAVFNLVYFHC
jgi:hypothetical protein